jgi:hypothetical protein
MPDASAVPVMSSDGSSDGSESDRGEVPEGRRRVAAVGQLDPARDDGVADELVEVQAGRKRTLLHRSADDATAQREEEVPAKSVQVGSAWLLDLASLHGC